MVRYAITSVALPELTLDDTVALASRLGYDGIELRVRRVPEQAVGQPYSFWGNHRNDLTPDTFVEQARAIREACRNAGLSIPALACNASATDLEDLRRLAEGAAICGCPLVRIGAPRRYDGSVEYRVLYAEALEAFGRALDVVQSFGVRGLLEIHGGTITVSAGLALRLVEHFSPAAIGVIYDVQNMVKEGYEGMRLGLDVLGPYLAHVHIGGHGPEPGTRDANGTLDWTWRSRDVSDGLLSMPALLSELRRVGYRGFITVEDFRSDITVEEKFGGAIRYLRSLEE